MPPPKQKSLQQQVSDLGVYPPEAFDFVQDGLRHTVNKLHGPAGDASANRHVSGRDLCLGLREVALSHWGLMAQTVLSRWNITTTLDFGRIVFALIEIGHLQKTEADRLDDFREVFDFRTAFEGGYSIPPASAQP